ncbi:MAG: hypothetical protein ACI87H_003648, partial [Gammaproteobacteria bacterium]
RSGSINGLVPGSGFVFRLKSGIGRIIKKLSAK